MFSLDDFSLLAFLEGRWRGEGADGKVFYEQYDRPAAGTFRSRHFVSDAFDDYTEGSTITYLDGEVRSTWGPLSWRATHIDADGATFEPINAPSQFIWRRLDGATLEADQHWQAEGRAQRHTVRLTRLVRLD
jgi:hypothetical protein